MHRFYVDNLSELNKSITIEGEDVNHIKNVLRLTIGDSITVSDGSSRDYECVISSISDVVTADIVDIHDCNAELPVKLRLFQGVPKADKFELIIQKAVELGASEVIPVMMERTVVKLDDKKQDKKLERYRKIAEAAAKQSRRGIIPEVSSYISFKNAVKSLTEAEDNIKRLILVPYESAEGMDYARSIIASAGEYDEIDIFIGPEGGFAESEIELAKQSGASIISLGNRILRTETAGLAILSILGFTLDR
jgi:16S rRNA (uracil1498-N3)-methyltransferase